MRITFHDVTWENLLSTGAAPITFTLDQYKTTLVVGANGAGKSTILEALTFGLFGKPFRDMLKGELVNDINGKGTKVTVNLTVNGKRYTITRGIKPNIFTIEQDGKLIDQKAGIKNQQEWFETYVLRINQKTFAQMAILGKNFVPFMRLPAAERRAVVEDILDIQVFAGMAEYVKEQLSFVKEDLTEAQMKLRTIESNLEIKRQHVAKIERYREMETSKYDAIAAQVKDAKDKKSEIEGRLKINEPLAQSRDRMTKQIEGQENQRLLLNRERESALKEMDAARKAKVCSKCGQPVTPKHINEVVAELKQKTEDLSIKAEEILNETANLKIKLEQTPVVDLGDDKARLQEAIIEIRMLEAQLKEAAVPAFDYEDEQKQVAALQKSFESKAKEIDQIEKTRSTLTTASKILKDDGIKAYIIKKYIGTINNRINSYLKKLGLAVGFVMDEFFETTIKARGSARSYNSFSEGEKMRIDLAILFAWRDIANSKNSISTNLLFLDEVFDASMDDAGCEAFSGLIRELGETTNVCVISHRGETLYEQFQRVLEFQFKSAFSRMRSLTRED